MDKLFVTGGNPGALFRLDLGVGGLAILPAPDRVDGALPK